VSRLILMLVFAGATVNAQTAPAVLPCDNKSVEGTVDAFRVVTARLVYVNCDVTTLTKFDTSATLSIVEPGGTKPVQGVTASVRLFESGDSWLRIDLTKAAGLEVLQAGQNYELVLAPDHNAAVAKFSGTVQGPFEPLKIPFSTKPKAVIRTGLVEDFGVAFEIYSPLALRTFGPNDPKFAEVILGNLRTYHLAKTQPRGPTVTECQAQASCPAPDTENPGNYGRAAVTLVTDHLYQSKATLEITGLTNLFDQPLKIQNDVVLGAVPSTKDDSMWYLKLDHQAGVGSKPGFAIEARIAPTLGRPVLGEFFWKPALAMDIGSGSVSNVSVNDTIVPSLGLTRLKRWDRRGLEAVRFTPALSFETNREFTKRNVVYDQDTQFFISGLMSTRLQRSWARFNQMQKDPATKDESFRTDLADGGMGLQLFLGVEAGHAIDSITVSASNSSASVVIPTFLVARIRPKLVAFAEYKRLTFTVSAVPRFLAATEYTTRQSDDGKSIRLIPVSGFRPYGEAGVSIGLDSSGHVALNTTYKLGSQPPTFRHANTVQSGLLLKY
jgi:hypothetical protein